MIRDTIYCAAALALGAAVLTPAGCATTDETEAESATQSPEFRPPEILNGELIDGHVLTTRELFHPEIPEDVGFILLDTDDYDGAYRLAIEALRDAGFRIARDDPRFGVITTYPKDAPTIFEPWVGDNATYTQARDATLNDLRRVVTVELRRNDFHDWIDEITDGSFDPSDDSMYALVIEVAVERRQEPTRYLTHSARGSIIAHYSEAPVRLAQRGLDETYWEPIGTDAHMANRLLEAINQRLTRRRDGDG